MAATLAFPYNRKKRNELLKNGTQFLREDFFLGPTIWVILAMDKITFKLKETWK